MNIRQRMSKREKSRTEMCKCSAYPFGHRMGGGKCHKEKLMKIVPVPYYMTQQAMYDAGHKPEDF